MVLAHKSSSQPAGSRSLAADAAMTAPQDLVRKKFIDRGSTGLAASGAECPSTANGSRP
jgi:hypothetical protein